MTPSRLSTLVVFLALCTCFLVGDAPAAATPTDSAPKKPAAKKTAAKKSTVYDEKVDVIYGQYAGVALVMDIFAPTGPKNGLAIVDVISGGWSSDRAKIEDHRRGRFYDIFCGRGYTVFAIRPGSASHFSAPEMVKNLRKGIAWLRERAAEFGIDPNNMGLTGASAGGHLACLLAVTTPASADKKQDQPFKAVAVFFPPTDFVKWGDATLDYTKGDRFSRMVQGLALSRVEQGGKPLDKEALDERIRKISPTRVVAQKQPPFLIYHGDADPLVPLQQSEVFIAALKKAGGSAELVVKKGGGHPWFTINEEVKLMADWFDKQLRGKSPETPKPETSKSAQTAK